MARLASLSVFHFDIVHGCQLRADMPICGRCEA